MDFTADRTHADPTPSPPGAEGAAARAEIDALNARAWEARFTEPQSGVRVAREARAMAERIGYRGGVAYALRAQGACEVLLMEHDAALAHLGEAAETLRELGDVEGSASALNRIGNAHLRRSDIPAALAALLEALRLQRGTGDRMGESDTLNFLGTTYYQVGEYARALEFYRDSLRIKETLGDGRGVSHCLNNIGNIHGRLGEYAEALDYHERALALKREVGDWPGEGISLVNVGSSHEHLGDHPRALACYTEALALARRTGERYTEADALRNLGEVRRKEGDHARALEHLRDALEVCHAAGLRQVEADARIALGRTLADAGDPEGALAQLERALEGAREIQARVHVYEAHRALSEVHERRGDLPAALRHFKAFHEAEDEVFSAEAEKRIQSLLVQAEMERSQREAELLRMKNDELTAANRALREADEEKARLLAQLRRQAEALERLAREDALTGLSNRRHVDERLALEWERARRFGRDLTVVMADLDHFKEVNDRFSHAAGDAVLRALGRLLRERVRGIDVVGRYGGEEFVLVLVETPPDKAARFCEKLRAAIEAHDWETVHPGVRITMSLGLSGDLSVDSPQAMLAAADARLYEAKRAGRNRVRD